MNTDPKPSASEIRHALPAELRARSRRRPRSSRRCAPTFGWIRVC